MRQDVVRLLGGRCADPHAPCQFNQNGHQIRLIFSGSAVKDFYECAKELPADTVLLIEDTPADPIPMREMRLGRNLKSLGATIFGFRGYVDQREGLVLKTYKGKVIQLNYVATTKEKHRCRDYYQNPSDFVQVITHCPPVTLEGPRGAVEAGDKVTFRANVIEDPKMTLSWILNAGKMIGARTTTRTISVDTAGLEGQTLKVTVQAQGSCSVETSYDVRITRRNP
jgi:hypothetical protein